MKLKKQLPLIVMSIICILVPTIAGADAVPWASEEYTARVGSLGGVKDTQSGLPLPVSASYSTTFGSIPNTADSTITSTYMDVDAFSWDSLPVWAEAVVSGTYIASAATPLFQFTYDGYYTSVNPDYALASEHYAWFTITDLSTSTVLYNNSSLTLDNNTYTIEVPTIAGNEIGVEFGAKAHAYRVVYDQTESVMLNYSTAVVPEPISSILFVVGGTLLAGRGVLRRAKVRKRGSQK